MVKVDRVDWGAESKLMLGLIKNLNLGEPEYGAASAKSGAGVYPSATPAYGTSVYTPTAKPVQAIGLTVTHQQRQAAGHARLPAAAP